MIKWFLILWILYSLVTVYISHLLSILSGIIYDVIVEPPSIGSTTDERGNSKPVSEVFLSRQQDRNVLTVSEINFFEYHPSGLTPKKNCQP